MVGFRIQGFNRGIVVLVSAFQRNFKVLRVNEVVTLAASVYTTYLGAPFTYVPSSCRWRFFENLSLELIM